jgi:hypothetical protein
MLLVSAVLLSSCSMLTAQGRRERAYERYVRKSSLGRVKQQKRMSFHKTTLPIMEPSEPTETTTVSGPEAVGSGSGY